MEGALSCCRCGGSSLLNDVGATSPLLTLLPVSAVTVLSRVGCGLAAVSGHGAGTCLRAYTSG
jgi:hypothetical protein